MSARPKAPVSDERYDIKLAVRGRDHSALMRPCNFDELREASAFEDDNEKAMQMFDLCAVEFDPKLPTTARRSLGHNILELAGNDLVATEITEHELSDEAAQVLVERREKMPSRDFVCLEMDDRHYVFVEPHPSIIDSAVAKKRKGSSIDVELGVVTQHLAYGDLEYLKREKPVGVLALCKKLMDLHGVGLAAVVKKV